MNGLVKVGAALAAAAIAGTTALTMMVGTALGGATAAAAAVVPPPPTVCDVATVALTAEQTSNAQIIMSVGQQLSVGVGGLEVALITAIVESDLRNLNHGDADSLGLFQQRPSQGWGTPAQIMDPTYASTRFYQALTAVPGWTTMDPGAAAQTVQRSAFPARYDLAIPEALGILGGTCTPTGPPPSGSAAPFTTRPGETVLPRPNPHTIAQAILYAQQQAGPTGDHVWYRACLAFVAIANGWSFSGTDYTVDQYLRVTPAVFRHDGDRRPELGALLYWQTSGRAGHVALYVGQGMIASNDIRIDGRISIVPATDIETRWGGRYIGWAPPFFPGGG